MKHGKTGKKWQPVQTLNNQIQEEFGNTSVCFTALLTCDSFLSSHLSSFYLTGVFSQLHISVLLNQMPVERRAEYQ